MRNNWAGRFPDAIVYPTGGGLGAIGIYKAFRELQALGWIDAGPLPKLIVTQYQGCAPIVRAFDAGADHAQPWTELDVPPGGLKSTRPPGDQAVLELLRETNGCALAIESEDAIASAAQVSACEGLFPCPEVGTAIAGLRQALATDILNRGDRVVVLFTGSGLKSIPVLPLADAQHITCNDALPA